MRIKAVEVGYTYNMGNFESLRLALQAEIAEDEQPEDVSGIIDMLKQKIDSEAARLKAKRR